MNDYAPKLKKILKDAGCELVRQASGSHERWHSPVTNKRFTVPQKIKRRHTANGCLADAGLPKQF